MSAASHPTETIANAGAPGEETVTSFAVHPGVPREIPMSAPDLTQAEIEAVSEVLAGPVLSMGRQLEEFEAAVAAYTGTRHAVGVNSGTSGLHLAIIAGGVGEGDLVITTPFSFIASANCILYERAIPVFVDVDPSSGNIDPQQVAEAAEDLAQGGARAGRWLPPSLRHTAKLSRLELKALLPVHAFGQPADLDPLLATARTFGLKVIEDGCEALGAEYHGRRIGSLSEVTVFAFYPNKQITTGEGGMLVTNDDRLAALYRSLRNQGRDEFNAWLNHSRLGYNYRLDEMSAALGRAQMARVDQLLARRAQVAGWYTERLAGSELVRPPYIAPTTSRMSWFVYVVRIHPDIDRDELIHRLQQRRIPTRPYFTPIHLQPFYRERFGYHPGNFPATETLGIVSLALPFSSRMSEEQVDIVCSHLLDLLPAMVRRRPLERGQT